MPLDAPVISTVRPRKNPRKGLKNSSSRAMRHQALDKSQPCSHPARIPSLALPYGYGGNPIANLQLGYLSVLQCFPTRPSRLIAQPFEVVAHDQQVTRAAATIDHP